MALPPLTYDLSFNKSSRRITSILKDYWEYIKEQRSFPSLSEINKEEISEIWSNCFIVKADNSCYSPDDYEYVSLGDNVKKAFGEDLTGMTIEQMQLPEAKHLAEKYEKVLATKLPVYDAGELSLENDQSVLYRQILLPLGENGITIKAIIGAMSYKISD
jgi:hypothetical protein